MLQNSKPLGLALYWDRFRCSPWGDSDVGLLLSESVSPQLLDSAEWPYSTLPGELEGKWDINNDLLLSWLGTSLDDLEVLSADIANVASNIQEAKGGNEDLASMAILKGKAGISDQMWETVGTAQQASLSIVGKALLSALNGGLQCKSWGTVWLVLLEALLEVLELLLLKLSVSLALAAGGQAGDVCIGSIDISKANDCSQRSSCSSSANLLNSFLLLGSA